MSTSGNTSYRNTLLSFEPARLDVRIFKAPWTFTVGSVVMLPRHLSNFNAKSQTGPRYCCAVMTISWYESAFCFTAFCDGNPPVTDGFISQRLANVIWNVDVFVEVCLDKLLTTWHPSVDLVKGCKSAWTSCCINNRIAGALRLLKHHVISL